MRNLVLRTGSSGPLVRDLQCRLNDRLNPSPDLKLNGYFSAQTEQALLGFQRCLWLEPSGVAEQSTLDALYDTELVPPILHNVPYISQLTPGLRWTAATAMLTQSTAQQVRRLTPAGLMHSSGCLNAAPSREARLANYTAFARAQKLSYLPPQTWPVVGLLDLLHNGPLMIEFVHPATSLRRGDILPGLFLILCGARGSQEPDGKTTTLRMHDPDDSQGRGIQSVLYANLLRRMQFASFGIFTR